MYFKSHEHINFRKLLLSWLLLLFYSQLVAQKILPANSNKLVPNFSNNNIPFLPPQIDPYVFGGVSHFIENIGQYGETLSGQESLGKIKYGYEGMDLPVLFTEKGVIYLQRKLSYLPEEEWERLERSGKLDKNEEEELLHEDRLLTMEWVGANPHPVIETAIPSDFYKTYGLLKGKAKLFKQIIYRNLYPGIDMIYSFPENDKHGFEYSFRVHSGADPSVIRMRWGGDLRELKIDELGRLKASSDINTIIQTMPVTVYENETGKAQPGKQDAGRVKSIFKLDKKDLNFVFPDGYDTSRSLLIDPFVSSLANFVGSNTGIAKDIDFDYQGNIYVSGGGNIISHQLAKFSPTGTLLWTFNGVLTNPSWSWGSNYGGWVVEKTTGNIYLGQGGTAAYRIVRLSSSGVYDNYITPTDSRFQENWKMIYSCGGASSRILIAGGGSSTDNINFGIFTPPSTVLAPLNITGQLSGHQDIADAVLDPKTNDLYTILAQGFIPVITENNKMYKHNSPYNSTNISWTRMSGFTVLNERGNRPYLDPAGIGSLNDNSINALAVNSNYLFYYDGKNLKAYSKSNGSDVGSPVITVNQQLMRGGIIADECNNVYVGSTGGIIKVYKFDGTNFNDGAANDITIAGNSNSDVYDLAYDHSRNLIYACGRGFVASVDISAYCADKIYTVAVIPDCNTLSVQASISPALAPGSTLTYALYNGNTQLTTNSTGTFTGLNGSTNYTVRALINETCGGTQSAKDFDFKNCNLPVFTGSGIYVPNAFTPNANGRNDILRAIPYGIKTFKHFSIYNRWGERVFTTQNHFIGWDGLYRGKKQDPGVYVWMAEAIDLMDHTIQLKGTTTLIR